MVSIQAAEYTHDIELAMFLLSLADEKFIHKENKQKKDYLGQEECDTFK